MKLLPVPRSPFPILTRKLFQQSLISGDKAVLKDIPIRLPIRLPIRGRREASALVQAVKRDNKDKPSSWDLSHQVR